MFQIDIVYLKSKSVFNHQIPSEKSLFGGRLFDPGNEIGSINGYYYFTGDYEFSLGLTDSCLFVLHICSILRNANNGNFVYKMFFRHGFRLHTFYMKYILFMFTTGGIGDVFPRCLQMVRMWRKVFFLLQLKFDSLHEISVQFLE